jgi:hypothetical protein
LVGEPERWRPLGRPERRWEYNITINFRERGWMGMDWLHLAQDRKQWWVALNTIMNMYIS